MQVFNEFDSMTFSADAIFDVANRPREVRSPFVAKRMIDNRRGEADSAAKEGY